MPNCNDCDSRIDNKSVERIMNMRIYAPGIEITITGTNKVDTACDVVSTIMERIFYDDELKNDVITMHKESGDILEIMLRPNPENGILKGFNVQNKWLCLPDAKDVARNFIADKQIKQ